MGRITTDPADKLTEAYYQKVDPVAHDTGAYTRELATSIQTGWDAAMRNESTDWHPAVDVHFLIRLDPARRVITVVSQSSRATPELLARYRAMLEAIRPPPYSNALRSKFGSEPLRIQLDFINVKTPAPGADRGG